MRTWTASFEELEHEVRARTGVSSTGQQFNIGAASDSTSRVVVFFVVVCFFVLFFFRRCPMRAVRQLATLDKWMCAPPACLNLCSLCTCALLDCDRYGQVRAFLEIWMCDFVCTLLDSANALLDCWTTTYAHFREYKQEVCGGQYH